MNTENINGYTINCTEAQTKKALELGAPLFRLYGTGCSDYIDMIIISDTEAYTIPTAEQMIGWLRSKGFRFKIVEYESCVYWQYSIDDYFEHNNKPSAKEATLEAIDAALEYLNNNKNHD